MKIKLYFDGFWNGFTDGSDPVNVKFFIKLFSKVYDTEDVNISSFKEANVLVESVFLKESNKNKKKWMHTYLFSGESYIRPDYEKYDCVLYGKQTRNNIVSLPLFVPYIFCNAGEEFLFENKPLQVEKMPEKDVVVFISNPGGSVRNLFLQKLEEKVNVTYAGRYKNNIGFLFTDAYNTKAFYDFVSQFKFVITMENSHEETYITEKITHGFFSGNIPVYWGSPNVHKYINSDRILTLENINAIDHIVEKIKHMTSEEWLQKVHTKPFTDYSSNIMWNETIMDIKKCLNKLPNRSSK